MNRIIMMGCISLCVLFSIVASGQYSYDGSGLYAELNSESMVFSLGSIQAEGTVKGIPAEGFIDAINEISMDPIIDQFIPQSLIENLHIFPLLGSITEMKISNLTIVPQQVLEIVDPIDYLDFIDEIESFSSITISLSDGLYLMGTSGEPIKYQYSHDAGLSGFIFFPLEELDEVQSFFGLSEKNSTAQYDYEGQYLMIYPFSNQYSIEIKSLNGNVLWTDEEEQPILFFKNDGFSIKESSFVHIIPLPQSSSSNFQYNIQPSKEIPDILTLFSHVEAFGDEFDLSQVPFLSDSDQGPQLLESLSSMLNGGILFINHTGPVEIDGSTQSIKEFGFFRVDQATVTTSSTSANVQADYNLVFLGDHFYSSQAKTSEMGVSVPVIPIILWIIAIGLVLVFTLFHLKTDGKYEIIDQKINYFLFILHILGYIIAFILLDFALSHQFGISFMTELSLNGFSFVAGIFLLIQLILFLIGFIFFALPLGIIFSKIMVYFGFDKNYRHGMKTVSALSIWPFISLYLTMFVNVVLLIFNPFNAMV